MKIQTCELHRKMQKVSKFPLAHVPSGIYANPAKAFLSQ
jgi:hypothetical protein